MTRELRRWFEGRRALVVGLGKSGAAAAGLLARLGARVSATDASSRPEGAVGLPRGVRLETGGRRLLRETYDLLVVSPGIPAEVWERHGRAGTPVWGELELGFRVLTLAGRWPRRSAAVTGTNGKTTTTALLAEMFRAAGWTTYAAGNIGTPLCALAHRIRAEDALALEVSSYQLETALAFRPAAGAVLNVTPDHLGRHGTMEAYARAKFRLFRSMGPGDGAVLNAADPWCRRLAAAVPARVIWFGGRGPGVFERGGRLVSSLPGGGSWPPPRHLPGRHNRENALAAVACARALGVPGEAIGRALARFPGVEHRIETVRSRQGVKFVNDSKATNVDSTRVALEALDGPLWVILGGRDKGAPYAPLRSLLRRKAKGLLLIGEAAPRIEREMGAVPVLRCGTLEAALGRAARDAVAGDTVLLSPACASFDQFENFEHRGRRFKELVEALP